MFKNIIENFIKPAAADACNLLIDSLFPIKCLVCGLEGSFICFLCQKELAPVQKQKCPACGRPSPFGLTHSGCQSPLGADGLISIYDYHDSKVSEVIIQGKYSFLPGAYETLGRMLSGIIKVSHGQLLNTGSLLVPIPLSPSRNRWRGFNQAEVLCKTLGRELGLETIDALVRYRSTKTQKDLKKEQRIKNVVGCFKIKTGADVKDKEIILVDDVVTTGSTMMEAAKVLKRNGAAKVWCLAAAQD